MTSPRATSSLALRADDELMLVYLSGDNAAFLEIVRRHGPALHRFIAYGLYSTEEAKDLVQQTFLQVHRARLDFDTREPLRPWLFAIGLNVKREYLRHVRRLNETKSLIHLEARALADPAFTSQVEAKHDLEFALSRLSAAHREVLELHWFAGLSFDEVGKVLGDSTLAVRVRAHRGVLKIRQIFREPQRAPKR